jgi:hypothetical protein
MKAYVPMKKNSRSTPKGSPAYSRTWHLFMAHRPDFMKIYKLRVAVEQTFSALKRRLNEPIRSLNPVAQVNEGLCKVVVFNLMMVIRWMLELGIDPNFAGPSKTPDSGTSKTPISSETTQEYGDSQSQLSPNSTGCLTSETEERI